MQGFFIFDFFNIFIMNKRLLLLSFYIFSNILFSQEKKYQSLLWEISGKNLTKKSYIYGSMHVSDKVSYHLSDAFFKHLLEADMIANESDPATWHELSTLYLNNTPNPYEDGFYKRFVSKPIDKTALNNLFLVNDFMMNNLLFRTNNFQSDYQEETYLDMFIYQTGRKFNKKNIGLEDTFESMKLVSNVDYENIKPDLDKQQNLAKFLNGKTVDEVLKDLYREKNLDMLDSLMILSSPQPLLEAMLYKRNVIMTKSIDSLIQKGSLFAAVGAAHLPGQKGIIERLRSKGYTVNAVISDYTEKGKAQKKLIDQTFIKPKQIDFVSSDQMIHAKVFENVQHNDKTISSPDLSNGSFIQIKRLPLNDFLVDKIKKFNHKSLDSLLFENLQGDIISKIIKESNGFKFYDLKNKTKTGDFQRHQFYITPLEIIGINLVGKLDFVNQYESSIFNQLKIGNSNADYIIAEPKYSNFSINMPPYYVIYGDESTSTLSSPNEVYGYDSSNESYFICVENKLFDFDYLENTTFELNRIQDEYLNELDISHNKTIIRETPNTMTSQINIKNQSSYLQTRVHENNYYLLAAINTNEEKAINYFNSFKYAPKAIQENFSIYKDTASLVNIGVPYKQNLNLFLKTSTKEPVKMISNKTNYFGEFDQSLLIKSESKNAVIFNTKKFHKYFEAKHIDTLVSNYKKLWEVGDKNFSQEVLLEKTESESINTEEEDIFLEKENNLSSYTTYYSAKNIGKLNSSWDKLLGFDKQLIIKNKIINDKVVFDQNKKAHLYEGLVVKDGSNQAIKFKYYIKDGVTYELKSIVDTHSSPSGFFDTIDHNIKPFDSILSPSVFSDKLDLFFEDVKSKHDSIRFSALSSISYLNLEEKDFLKIQGFLRDFEFRKEEKGFISALFNKIGEIKSHETIAFLKDNYKENVDNANVQFAIIKALALQKNKKAYEVINELLDYDLPISDDIVSINQMFMIFELDPDNSQILLPDVLKYYSIKDYHDAVFNFITSLNNNEKLTTKHIKSFKAMLLVNAKLEYKRVNSWIINQDDSQESFVKPFDVVQNLIKFIKLLYPYKESNDVNIFLEKSKKLEFKEILMTFANLELKYNHKLSPDFKERLLENPETLFTTYLLLSEKEKDELKIENNKLILSVITIIDEVNYNIHKIDSLFEKSRVVNDKKIIFYYYKLSTIDNSNNTIGFGNSPKLLSVGFVLDNNNQPIMRSFYSGLQKIIENDDKIDDLANQVIDEALNQNKPRATFGKLSSTPLGFEMYY